MQPYLIFFVDENIKPGVIPFERIEESLSGIIKVIDYVHYSPLQGEPDKELIEHFNKKLKQLNCSRDFKAFFVTCDTGFPRQWGEINKEEHFQRHSDFHLIFLTLGHYAFQQERQVVEPNFYDTEKVNPQKVKDLRRELRKQIIVKCRKFLNPRPLKKPSS